MKTNTQPRLAIIGCDAVVQTHLLPALRQIGWLPQVLAEPTRKNLDATIRLVGKGSLRAAVADWREAVDSFDAAIVAAPHAYRGSIGAELAAAGKHVFMEKTLATSAADGKAILEAAAKGGTIVSTGLLRRHLHVARWTAELLRSGILGQIRHFEAREGFVSNWAAGTDASLSPQASGGGVLMDGVHTIDLITWWLGEMATVIYRDDSCGGVAADCVIECELASGGSGMIELSRSRDLPNTCRIEGTKGFVEVHLCKNEVIACSADVRDFRVNGVGVDAFPEQGSPQLFSAALADFRSSIVEGRQKGVDGQEGLATASLIERCCATRSTLTMPWAEPTAPAHGTPVTLPGNRVAITGATGFIGGRLAERLLDQGKQVRCLVRNIGSAARLARLPVEIVRVDLADEAGVKKALEGCDHVFHCAYDPRSLAQNRAAARNVVAASLAHNVKRLVHLSTFSVYEPFPDGHLSEDTPDGDKSLVYTRTKLELETKVLDAARKQGLRGTVLQPTIVYGPFSRPWTIGPAEMLLYGTLILPDRAEGICNAVYIDDLIDAMLLAAVKEEAIGQRFIVSGPDAVTWGHFFEQFASVLGTKRPEYRPAKEIAKQNSGLMHDIRMVTSNPKMIAQIVVRSPAVRRLVQYGLDSLPKSLHDLVNRKYFGTGERSIGKIHRPDPQQVRLYTAKPVVGSEKARELLGYKPRVAFSAGMELTGRYLNWAYGHHQRLATRSEPQQQWPVNIAPSQSVADAD
jgi:nucleoside-diphosphate-sugar epimerase/predicted dehydrogenase